MKQRSGKQVLDYSRVDQMLRSGMTQTQVATIFGVTQPAISQARRRGVVKEGATVAPGGTGVPWKVRPEHWNYYLPKMLRCAARAESGAEIGESLKPQLAGFIRGLEELNAVIHYDPEVEPYFFRVPRRNGIDTWWTRDPHRADDGSEI